MSQRQSCIAHCKEQLEQRNSLQYFNMPDFNHIYRKFDGANRNAYLIGLGVADFIIYNAKKITDESRDEE